MTDTSGNIKEHTKIKLDVYINYLLAYISVIKNLSWVNEINIYDIFAGQGKSENNKDGSALLAHKIIKSYKSDGKDNNKPINLYLNEADSEKVKKLNKYIDIDKHPHVTVTNSFADDYITALKPSSNGHSLIFIDPYGYTKISGKNLDKIFNRKQTDVIMFIPVFHIYRFIRTNEGDEQLASIARFLNDMGIDEKSVQLPNFEISNLYDAILKSIEAKSNYGHCDYYTIKHEKNCSEYALFFKSGSLKGLEKFYESLLKTDDTNPKSKQYDLFDKPDEQYIIDYLKENGSVTNAYMYRLGMYYKYPPKKINQQLKNLEDNGIIEVSCLTEKPRKGKAFYINYDNFNNQIHLIEIKLKER